MILSRRTIITVILAAIGIAAAWVHHARQSDGADAAARERPLLASEQLPVDDVDRITITRRGETPLVFARQEDGRTWLQLEPVEHAIDAYSMHQMISVARRLAVIDAFAPGAGDDVMSAAALSLDPPLAEITYQWPEGGSLTLASGRRGLAGRAYARVAGSDEVCVVGQGLYERIVEMNPWEWRDRHLFPDASVEADRIELYDGATRVVLVADRKRWSMEEPVRTRVDEAARDALVQGLARAQCGGFIVDDPESLADFGLDEPVGTVAVTVTRVSETDGVIERTPVTRRLLIGPRIGGAQDRFGMLEGSRTVVRVGAGALQAMFRSAEQLADPTASGVQPADIKTIRIQVGDDAWAIERDLDRWYDPARREEIPVATVGELVAQLTTLRAPKVVIQEFPRELQVAQVTLHGFDGRPLDTVRIAVDATTGEWALENGDGVLRVFPASMQMKLRPEEHGLEAGLRP